MANSLCHILMQSWLLYCDWGNKQAFCCLLLTFCHSLCLQINSNTVLVQHSSVCHVGISVGSSGVMLVMKSSSLHPSGWRLPQHVCSIYLVLYAARQPLSVIWQHQCCTRLDARVEEAAALCWFLP